MFRVLRQNEVDLSRSFIPASLFHPNIQNKIIPIAVFNVCCSKSSFLQPKHSKNDRTPLLLYLQKLYFFFFNMHDIQQVVRRFTNQYPIE